MTASTPPTLNALLHAAASDGSPPSAESGRLTIRGLCRRYRWRLLATYALFNVENLLRLAQPLILGLAINGLLRNSYSGLFVFAAQHLAHMLIGTIRKAYDTRAFTAIYTDLASDLILDQRSQNIEVSRVVARAALARGYVDFFEEYVPLVMRGTYGVAGSLAMLAVYDWRLIPYCGVLVIPALLLNSSYARRTLADSRGLHDRLEQEVGVIERADLSEVRSHYDEVGYWRIRLSDAEAANFCLMELFVLAVIAASLVQFCTGGPQTGDVFAVFRYVMMFLMGMDVVPRIVHQTSRMRDIASRR
ncbi:MAG: hypothetical protein KDA79_17175 [Planctomycetaceae bacterium]|nr:hypothetical protein [Planctomycetaceae bacterium]